MKRKLFIFLSAVIFCVCASVGFIGCGDGGSADSGTTDGDTTNTGSADGDTTGGDTTGGGTTGGDTTGGDTTGGGTSGGDTSGSETEHTHVLVSVAGVSATCTEDGYEAYWQCSGCGKYFADAEGASEIDAPVAIAATGHEYTTTFNWIQDASGAWTATATRVCSHDASHTDTVDAVVTVETTAATCTEEGDADYTAVASFADGLGDATEVKTVTGVSLGHSYSAAFTFASDYSSATAVLTCTRCGDVVNVPASDITITSSVVEATCTENGATTYTAVYGAYTASESVAIPATGHSYSSGWTYDADGHWHAADCGHDVTSGYAAHTMVQNSSGNYVCSVCGYTVDGSTTSYITENGGKLIVGDNYITLSSYNADYGYITNYGTIYLDAAQYGDGVYKLSLSGTAGELYFYDADGVMHYISVGGSDSIELDEAQDMTVYMILLYTEDTNPVTLCLTVSYEYKNVDYVVEGTESNPRLVSDISEYSSESVSVTVGAGESYYFTVATASDTIVSLRYSGSDSAVTFYQGSSAVTFAQNYAWVSGKIGGSVEQVTQYVFLATASGTTFKITNTSSEDKTVSFDCVYYSGYIVEGSNTINYPSNVAASGVSYNFYVSANTSGTSYKFTLASGTTSGVTLTVSYRNEVVDTLTLSDNEYIFTNARTQASTIMFTLSYSGTSDVKIVMTAEEWVVADTGADDTGMTYQALTLNEALTFDRTTFSISTVTYQYGFVSYTTTESGAYRLTLYCTSLASGMEYMFVNYVLKVYLNNEAVSGTYNSEDNSWNYELTLAAGENKIKIGLNTTSSAIVLTATISESDGSSGGVADTAIDLAVGANTVSEDTLYKFTAETAGTYTFKVTQIGDAKSGFTQFYASSSDWTAYFDQQNGDGDTYTQTFAAGETLYLYVKNGSEGNFIITIAQQ